MSEERVMRGRLEDLPLADIIQILATQQKTGTLLIDGERGKGIIVLHNGCIVYAISPSQRLNLTEILLNQGLLNEQQLAEALQIQREQEYQKRFSEILIERGYLVKHLLQETITLQLEDAVYDLLTWNSGEFSFQLDQVFFDSLVAIDPENLALESGVHPGKLLQKATTPRTRESSRDIPVVSPQKTENLMDSAPTSQRSTMSLSSEQNGISQQSVLNSSQHEEKSDKVTPFLERTDNEECLSESVDDDQVDLDQGVILVVDDESYFRRLVVDGLQKRGFQVIGCSDVTESLSEIAFHQNEEKLPLIAAIVDVIMPETEGEGILGGFELLNRLALIAPDIDIIMMSSTGDPELQYKADELGARCFLSKPMSTTSNFRESRSVIEAFIEEMTHLLEGFIHEKADKVKTLPDSGSERERSLSSRSDMQTHHQNGELSLDQFEQLDDAEEILMHLMRLVQHSFDWGVLYLIRKTDIFAVAGFSRDFGKQVVARPFKKLRFSREDAGLYSMILSTGKSFRGTLTLENIPGKVVELDPQFASCLHCVDSLHVQKKSIALLHTWVKLTSNRDNLIENIDATIREATNSLDRTFSRKRSLKGEQSDARVPRD